MEDWRPKGFCRLTRDLIIRLLHFETESQSSGCVHNVVKSWGALLIFSGTVHDSEFKQKTLCSHTCIVFFWPAKLNLPPCQNGCFFAMCINDK